jgi:outer membrane protein TolC
MPNLLRACRDRRALTQFSKRYLGAALLTAVLSPSITARAADSLPLVEAQQRAVQRSRQVAAQQAAVGASRDMAVAAGQLPDPVFKAGLDNLPVNGADRGSLTADFMTMRRIGVMQELTGADKRVLRRERFEREADKSLAEKDKAEAGVERETALAWFERSYAEAMAAAIDEQGAEARRELQAMDAAYRGGRASLSDVLAAKSAIALLDDRASDAARRVQAAKTMLARWVGGAANRPLATAPAIDTIRLDPATLETELGHHPAIAVLLRQEEIAATEAKLAEANRRADWTVELAFQQRGPAYSNMVSLGVSIPLQWDRKNRQDREVAAKRAVVEQARAEREEMLREHLAATQVLLAEWQSDRERIGRYRRELLPLAQERVDAVLAAYRAGKATLTDVLGARRAALDVRLAALQLEGDTAKLWSQLTFLFPISHGGASAAASNFTDSK